MRRTVTIRRKRLWVFVGIGLGLVGISCLVVQLACAERETTETCSGGIIHEIGSRTIMYRTSFEVGDDIPEAPQHVLTDRVAHSGRRSLEGVVTEPDRVRLLTVPFETRAGQLLDISFWVRSDNGVRCAVLVQWNEGRSDVLTDVPTVPEEWTRISVSCKSRLNAKGALKIYTPASMGAPVGRAWVDDLEIAELHAPPLTQDCVEDFPGLVADGKGGIWLAVLAQPLPRRQVRVYRVERTVRELIATFEPEGMTALGRPAVALLKEGCVVAFPVEVDGKWRITYAFVDSSETVPTCRRIESEGTANVLPAVAAVGEKACVVWESNAGGSRGIYASWIGREGAAQPQRISAADANNYNPDIVALENGTLFAAWDSVRDESADLYGAWRRNGEWQPEQRLTHDVRIERHVSLAAWRNDVWMAWQAESFEKHLINGLTEQRAVVAKLDANGMRVPQGLFDQVTPQSTLLKSPELAFDPEGRLWLTARRSMGQHQGWQPLAWCYAGDEWSGPHALWYDEGRWRPVTVAWNAEGGVAVVQRDAETRQSKPGTDREWRSEATLVAVKPAWAPRTGSLKTVPLEMPETSFRLEDRFKNGNAHFPRYHTEYKGERLTLYWGDLHEHTDISICQRFRNPPPHDLYANQRDVELLDFTAITDHGYNLNDYNWRYLAAQARSNHDPGRFVTFLAEEWTSDHIQYDPPLPYRRYGHRNVIFLDPYFDRYFNSHAGDISPRMLWDELEGVEFITIPHQLADAGSNCPTDWSFVHELLQPLAEIYQQRGSYEYGGCPRQAKKAWPGHFLQDAWARGIIIGVIASADHGGGHGKAGVWAKELTRESLFEAMRARHTFGASDAKIALYFTSGDAMMGDIITRTGNDPIPFHVRAVAARPINEVVIWRNNMMVYRDQPDATEVEFDWVDQKPLHADRFWYYVRVQCTDEELAWSSPIWFFPEER